MAPVMVLVLSASACAGSFEEARLVGLKTAPPMAKAAAAERGESKEAYCRALDKSRITAGAWGKGLGIAAGVVGAGGSAYAVVQDHDGSRVVLLTAGLVTLAAAAGSGALLFSSEETARAWVRECSS